MPTDTALFDLSDGVATLTLNRPEALNALNVEMIAGMRDALAELREPGRARVLVLRGAGRAFCAGADMAKGTGANTGDGPFDAGLVLEHHVNPLLEDLAALPLPVVSAVNGVAAGAGCSLALAADLVIADAAASFLLAFSKVGLTADAGISWILPRLVGLARATEMLMLAERIPAPKAEAWGLIHRSVDSAAFEAELAALVRRLAEGPTASHALTRRLLRAGGEQPYAGSLRLERELQREAGLTADFREGVAAFREKRPARFSGR